MELRANHVRGAVPCLINGAINNKFYNSIGFFLIAFKKEKNHCSGIRCLFLPLVCWILISGAKDGIRRVLKSTQYYRKYPRSLVPKHVLIYNRELIIVLGCSAQSTLNLTTYNNDEDSNEVVITTNETVLFICQANPMTSSYHIEWYRDGRKVTGNKCHNVIISNWMVHGWNKSDTISVAWCHHFLALLV